MSAGRRSMGAGRRVGLALGAGLALAAASFVLVHGAATSGELARGLVSAAVLLAAPWLARALALRVAARPAFVVGGAHALGQAAPLLAVGAARPDAFLPGLLLLFAANLFQRRASDAAAAGAAASAPIVVAVGFAVAPGVAWLALYPAAVAVALAGALALQARASERRARGRTAPQARVLRYAVPLTALLLVASFAVHVAVHVVPEPLLRLSAGDGTAETTPADAREGERAATRDARETFQQIFPGGLAHGRGVSQLQRETVMLVRPADARDHGQLYLRGMVLDVLTATGATFRGGAGRTRRAGPDGWIALQEPAGAAETLALEVIQQPIKIRAGELGILFAPERLLAIERAGVQHDPDGLLIALDPERDWFRFGCVVQERRAGYVALGARPALHPDPQYVARPSGAGTGVALERLDREARRAIGAAESDAERVVRLVRWFQAAFAYDLQAREFPGLDGLVAFVDAKRGPCTWFASAATLMLRGQGIPARIATGFVAKEYDAEQDAYVVTSSEGHAWIEVHFEELGWVTFDPTPGQQRANALAAALAGEGEVGLGAWARGLASRLGEWARSGGDVARMRDVVRSLADGPRAAWTALRERLGPRSAAALLGAAALAAALFRRRRARVPSPARSALPAGAGDARAATLRARLLASLARLGFQRRPPQTLQELVQLAASAAGVHALPAAGAVLDRARFGGVPLSAAEAERVEAALAELDRLAETL